MFTASKILAKPIAVIWIHGWGTNFYSPTYVMIGRELAAPGYTTISGNTRMHDLGNSLGYRDGKRIRGGGYWGRERGGPRSCRLGGFHRGSGLQAGGAGWTQCWLGGGAEVSGGKAGLTCSGSGPGFRCGSSRHQAAGPRSIGGSETPDGSRRTGRSDTRSKALFSFLHQHGDIPGYREHPAGIQRLFRRTARNLESRPYEW